VEWGCEHLDDVERLAELRLRSGIGSVYERRVNHPTMRHPCGEEFKCLRRVPSSHFSSTNRCRGA
jgi:hypothetical protein